jgi:hypothetical protein
MGSHLTLPEPTRPPNPTGAPPSRPPGRTPAAPLSAEDVFALLNPQRAALAHHPEPQVHRQQLRALEALDANGHRAWLEQALENPPTPLQLRQQRLAERASAAHPTSRDAEQAFDRLNPTFGVPADHADGIGHRDVAQRERALSLGVRVAVHDSRQNDPDPVIWQPGQDYRMADALHAARAQPTRARWGPERVGPER